jgi:GAF domain-containing protein
MTFISEPPTLAAPADADARMLRATAEIARILGAATRLDEALSRCARTLADELDLSFARIWTCDANGALAPAGGAGDPVVAWTDDGDRVLQRVMTLRRSYWAPNLRYALSDPALPWMREAGMASFAAFPLIHGAHVVGALAIAARRTAGTRLLCGLQSAAWILALGIAHPRAGDTRSRDDTPALRVANGGPAG